MLLELVSLPVVQTLGLSLKPGVDLLLGAEPLIDVPRLVHEVEDDPVSHALTELVSVDVTAEYFEAGLRVLLEQRGTGKAEEDRVGHHRLHHAVQLAALRAVALVHEHEHLTHSG